MRGGRARVIDSSVCGDEGSTKRVKGGFDERAAMHRRNTISPHV
jgi:hypothetical protein